MFCCTSLVSVCVCTIGDLLDEDQVLEFLTSLEAMELPDQIEEVNAKILEKIVQDTGYVAVLFCKYADRVCVAPIDG